MVRKIFFILFLLAVSRNLFAQDAKQKDVQDYQYKKEASGGIRLQTNGFSVYGEYGWIKDLFSTRLLQIEYTDDIDYRQKRQKAQIPDGRDFVFGMQNHLHTVRISYGIKRTIADKANRNGVRLSFIAFGGFSLALLKPYYLNLLQSDSSVTIKAERYSAANAGRFLDRDYIAEAAPIHYGLGQIQYVPGIHVKSGLDFDWGTKDEFVKAIEAGIMLDLFYKRLPIMINNYNRFYQLAIYLSFDLGKRW